MNDRVTAAHKQTYNSLTDRLLSELKVRHLANLFVAGTVFVVLGMTLYPFDFTTEGAGEQLAPFLQHDFTDLRPYKEDIITNILLFLPIGFAFTILTMRRRFRSWVAFAAVTGVGGGLSLLIEILQLFLPFRYPSFLDVAANTAGGAVGFVLYKLFAGLVYRLLTDAIERANSGQAAGWLTSVYLVYLMFLLAGAIPLQQAAFLAEFNKSTYPLAVGNEPTGNRPWTGSIKELILAKYPFSMQGVAEFLAGEAINHDDYRDVVAHYVFEGKAPYRDRTKLHAPLEWKGKNPDSSATDEARVSAKGWLQTGTEAYQMSSWFMETLRFTICLTVASRHPNVPHIARIVGVAPDPYHTNFAVVQIGDDLGVRFRSMTTGTNGMNPQFLVPNVFADTATHRIVASLYAWQLQVFVDSMEHRYQIELGPGFAFLNKFFPSNGRLSIASRLKNFHRVLFHIIVFVPLGYILALMVKEWKRGVLPRIVIACIGIAAPPYLLERVLCYMVGRELNVQNLALGLALMFASVIITLSSRLYRQRAAASAGAST